MKRSLFAFTTILALPAVAAVNVPLTVQETIYPGSIAGINRTADPVSVSVPLPDDPNNGASSPNTLTLAGASIGQFRVLGWWPSGRIKWLLIDTQANITAGQPNASIALVSGGNGNFGGPNLATDNSSSITVSPANAVDERRFL
jgi:hypothetical protein